VSLPRERCGGRPPQEGCADLSIRPYRLHFHADSRRLQPKGRAIIEYVESSLNDPYEVHIMMRR
jgi:hypothetical protein